jgi:hypothetical protein
MTDLNAGADQPRGFGWGAAILGGAVAIGGAAFFGTLVANVVVRMAIANGSSREQAFAALASGGASVVAFLSLLAVAIPGVAGGYLSAKYGRGRALAQAGAAGAIALSFVIVMYFNPSSQPGPPWFVALSLLAPLASSLLGGLLYARRI